jgi:hypothetical protein
MLQFSKDLNKEKNKICCEKEEVCGELEALRKELEYEKTEKEVREKKTAMVSAPLS